MLSVINNMDQTTLFFIQSIFHSLILDKLMILMTSLGDKGLIWLVTAIILIVNKKTGIAGLMTLTALILSTIMGEGIFKHLIQRPRPYIDFPGVNLLIQKSTAFSFPSGNTTSSFAAAYVLSRNFRQYSLLFWITASMIAFSRLYLFMHYPTDIFHELAISPPKGVKVIGKGEAAIMVWHIQLLQIFLWKLLQRDL